MAREIVGVLEMPLKPGKKYIGYNIKELVEHGHPRKQAIAIALHVARKRREKLKS